MKNKYDKQFSRQHHKDKRYKRKGVVTGLFVLMLITTNIVLVAYAFGQRANKEGTVEWSFDISDFAELLIVAAGGLSSGFIGYLVSNIGPGSKEETRPSNKKG